MATARRRDQWDQWAFMAAWIAKVATGKDVNPEKLNPIRAHEMERAQTHESKRQDAREMMALIGVALGDKKAVKKWLSTDRAKAEREVAQAPEAFAPEKPTSN